MKRRDLAKKGARALRLLGGGVHYRMLGYPCHSDVWGFPLHVRRSDVVLEVGAGGNPRVRSDILMDKYFEDRTEGKAKHVDDRAYVIGDGLQLPFRDRSVDYAICSHVVEHVQDPEHLLRELQRVTRRGFFVAAPSPCQELEHPAPYHRWYVDVQCDVLTFVGKTELRPRPAATTQSPAREQSETRYEVLHDSAPLKTRVEWPSGADMCEFEHAEFRVPTSVKNRAPLTPRRLLVRATRRLFRSSASWNLEPLLMCPVCGAGITLGVSVAKCIDGHAYPVVDGVPVLVLEARLT